jgi:hypothetical protein
MRKTVGLLMMCFLAASVIMCLPSLSQALTDKEIMDATQIINLEAIPIWFRPGQPIDFIVTLKYGGGPQDGFDVGVFHEARVVGWETNKRLNTGMNTFRLHDLNFKGDPGAYIVRVKFKGKIFREKRFATRPSCMFTIDPKAPPPPIPPPQK